MNDGNVKSVSHSYCLINHAEVNLVTTLIFYFSFYIIITSYYFVSFFWGPVEGGNNFNDTKSRILAQ